jgi:hypothetical protein
MFSIYVFTAIIIILFFPLIYFMWVSFIQYVIFRSKLKGQMPPDQDSVPDGEPQPIVSKNPHQFPTKPKLYNFVTADEFIKDLNDFSLPLSRQAAIIQQIATSQGVIRKAQQEELRNALNYFCQTEAFNTSALDDALEQLEKATLID